MTIDFDTVVLASYWKFRQAVYDAVKPIFAKAIREHPTIGPVADSMQRSGFDLLDRMIAVGRP